MKLKYHMEIIDIGGELMAVPYDSGDEFRGVLRMNDITSEILKLLEQDTTEDAIVSALAEEYDATEDTIREGVKQALGILAENDLLQ